MSNFYTDMSPYDGLGQEKTFPHARLYINSKADLERFLNNLEQKGVLYYPFCVEYEIKMNDFSTYSDYEFTISVSKRTYKKKVLK